MPSSAYPLRRPGRRISPPDQHALGTSRHPGFFLPVKVLSEVFRGKFAHGLKAAVPRKKLLLPRQRSTWLAEPKLLCTPSCDTLFRQDWVVYAKTPFGGPEHVLHYLARYTHRVAISNHRLVGFDDGKVTFRWKDYAHGARNA